MELKKIFDQNVSLEPFFDIDFVIVSYDVNFWAIGCCRSILNSLDKHNNKTSKIYIIHNGKSYEQISHFKDKIKDERVIHNIPYDEYSPYLKNITIFTRKNKGPSSYFWRSHPSIICYCIKYYLPEGKYIFVDHDCFFKDDFVGENKDEMINIRDNLFAFPHDSTATITAPMFYVNVSDAKSVLRDIPDFCFHAIEYNDDYVFPEKDILYGKFKYDTMKFLMYFLYENGFDNKIIFHKFSSYDHMWGSGKRLRDKNSYDYWSSLYDKFLLKDDFDFDRYCDTFKTLKKLISSSGSKMVEYFKSNSDKKIQIFSKNFEVSCDFDFFVRNECSDVVIFSICNENNDCSFHMSIGEFDKLFASFYSLDTNSWISEKHDQNISSGKHNLRVVFNDLDISVYLDGECVIKSNTRFVPKSFWNVVGGCCLVWGCPPKIEVPEVAIENLKYIEIPEVISNFNIFYRRKIKDSIYKIQCGQIDLRETCKYNDNDIREFHKSSTSNLIKDISNMDLYSGKSFESMSIVDKNKIRNDWHRYLNPKYMEYNPVLISSSGSTGSPFKFYLDTIEYDQNLMSSFVFYSYLMSGIDLENFESGDKIMTIRSLSGDHDRLIAARFTTEGFAINRDENYGECNNFSLKCYSTKKIDEMILRTIDIMRKYNIKNLVSAPSMIWKFIKVVRDRNITDLKIDRILTNGEMVYNSLKDDAMSTFGAITRDYYAAPDGSIAFYECEFGNYHHIYERSHVDIVDGFMVATSLWNRSFPFVKYNTFDIAGDRVYGCGCGRSGICLSKIAGRKSDFLVSPNGDEIPSIVIYSALSSGIDSIFEWRVEQISKDEVLIFLNSEKTEKGYNLFYKFFESMGFKPKIIYTDKVHSSGEKFRFIRNRTREDYDE